MYKMAYLLSKENNSWKHKSNMSSAWGLLCQIVLEVKSALMLAATWKSAQNKKTKAQICLTNAREFSVLWGNI